MLINTVILLLRDALPLFVVISLLWTQLSFNRLWLVISLTLGFFMIMFLVGQLSFIGTRFDGAGVELLMFFIHLANYCLALFLAYQLTTKLPNKRLIIFTGGCLVALTLINKGTSFTVYFSGYFQQIDALQPLLIGMFLGLGICLSLMVLIYFLVVWLDAKLSQPIGTMAILIYTIGQLTNALPLLVQVDVISSSATIWDSKHILSNQSEFGQLFNVLFGYQATPSFNQLILYIFALSLTITMYWWVYYHSAKQGKNP